MQPSTVLFVVIGTVVRFRVCLVACVYDKAIKQAPVICIELLGLCWMIVVDKIKYRLAP